MNEGRNGGQTELREAVMRNRKRVRLLLLWHRVREIKAQTDTDRCNLTHRCRSCCWVNSFSAWSSVDTLSSRDRSAWPRLGWVAVRRRMTLRMMWRRRNWMTYWGLIWKLRRLQHCPPAAEPQYYRCWGWGVVEGTLGSQGGAQEAD